MRYTITDVPNLSCCRKAAKALRPAGYHHRQRGRGYRHARYPGDIQFHQSLPLELAEKFTIYGAPAVNPPGVYWQPIVTRGKFIGLEADGRMRVRLLQERAQ